jgi:cyclopropane-fatty-acyl-phospholipid synthase
MPPTTYRKKAADLLALADVRLNGDRPWDMQVHNEDLYARVFSKGSVGLGEAYMDGWWDTQELDTLFDKILRAELEKKVTPLNILFHALTARLSNLQTKSHSVKVAKEHYDIGNDLYGKMLGKWMQYTCGYWKDVNTLDEAQEKKLDLICKKIMLKPGERVLELGCGFGGFARFAAERYGAQVTAYNISEEQVKYAREWCKGFPVEIVQSDYRNAKGNYDKVVAIGVGEHIGPKNYRGFMELAHRLLVDGGIFLYHSIGGNKSVHDIDPWIDKYIFPHAVLPSIAQLGRSFENLFVMEDWHNFGPYYDKTLLAWFENFDKSWPELKGKGSYDDRFYRMWKYYLLTCSGTFRSRLTQLWQIVLSKGGVPGGYTAVR